ncbi:MAG: hypothetical protein JWO58_3206 [Chitinophagaceae bacterium]|nr:hypothetical protein [Chitinophagaceae bacterium]
MKKHPVKPKKGDEQTEFPGYPLYPASEDIYSNAEKDSTVHPGEEEETEQDLRTGKWNEKGIEESLTGEDLDVPGAELDDASEATGDEDEENNYYSLGGDNHDD